MSGKLKSKRRRPLRLPNFFSTLKALLPEKATQTIRVPGTQNGGTLPETNIETPKMDGWNTSFLFGMAYMLV